MVYKKEEDLQSVSQEDGAAPASVTVSDSNSSRDDLQWPRVTIHSCSLGVCSKNFAICSCLYHMLIGKPAERCFQTLRANIALYHSKILKEIKRLEETGISVQVDGQDRAQILERLHECQKQISEWDYVNICNNVIHSGSNNSDILAPRLFIALPRDLNSWDDSDPSTHKFRLYYLCDVSHAGCMQSSLPQHKHISAHQGYNIRRPGEFFEKFGGYVLRVLNMVKHGFAGTQNAKLVTIFDRIWWRHTFLAVAELHEVPALETSNILWGYTGRSQ